MKLVLFVHNFPPEFLGGTEQVVRALAQAYAAAGDEVVVATGSDRQIDGGEVEEFSFDGLRVVRFVRDPEERYGLDLEYRRTGQRVVGFLRDERPAAVHVHHWSTLGWNLIQRAAALGIPGICTLHDLWTTCPRFFRRPPQGVRCPGDAGRGPCAACVQQDMPGAPLEMLAEAIGRRDAMLRQELESARVLVVPSRSQARLIERYLPWPHRLEVIPHGLLQPVHERAEPRGSNGTLRVGSFGNLVPDKGLDLLVEALSNFGDAVELRLAGAAPDPAYVDRLEARARALGVRFVWTGPYGAGDPHPALQLDLAIFPSLCHESYGLVVDEALARGVPVVVSAKGALAERARRGGVVVRSGGVSPLKVTLAGLLRSRRRLRELRNQIPDRFPTIAAAAARYRRLLAAQEVAS